MTPYLNFLSQIVNQTIFVVLMVGAAFALIAGLLLLLDSRRAFRIGEWLDRWVSTRQALQPLEKHHSIARPLYRMHRVAGALICAGALYALFVLATPQGATAIAKTLSGLGSRHFVEWISESLRLFLIVGNAGALVFGAIFIVRPSALKRLEAWADRSISGRKATKSLEIPHGAADQFARAHPRTIGVLVILGSLYVLLNLGYALLR